MVKTQEQRLIALCVDIAILFLLTRIGFGTFVPETGQKGFWFYSSLLSILVGSKIATPFFTKPADAFSYSIPALIALVFVYSWDGWQLPAKAAYLVSIIFPLVALIISIVAMTFKGSSHDVVNSVAALSRKVLQDVFSPQVIYAPMVVFALLAFHAGSEREMFAVGMALLVVSGASIGDFSIDIWERIRSLRFGFPVLQRVGTFVAYKQPSIILFRNLQPDRSHFFKWHICRNSEGLYDLVLALNAVGMDEKTLIRGISVKQFGSDNISAKPLRLPHEAVSELDDDKAVEISNQLGFDLIDRKNVVGLVAPGTTIRALKFEVVHGEYLEEGMLVRVKSYFGEDVVYQILSAITCEDVVYKKNTYGYVQAKAMQVGVWQPESGKFVQCDWVPAPNSLVEKINAEEYQFQYDAIGHIPKTSYPAKIADIDAMVTHNTAVLGILGVGKSMLSIELVERMMQQGIKVICLDLTRQYEKELSVYYDDAYEKRCLEAIKEACDSDRDASKENPEEGGSLPHLKSAVRADLHDFLHDENPRMLKIYNPSDFVPTKQKRERSTYKFGSGNDDWTREAGLFSVTPVEVTRIVSEEALNIVSDDMRDEARVCLVYEEAHSLVPEWNSVVDDSDRNASTGTAKAILQGRKYGLGCLLVTQRTANVTKTILNQCNTVFAMRTFDDTGKGFLANYIGGEYAEALPNLKAWQAVFFGKGSANENPVIIQTNPRNDFVSKFRAAYPPSALPQDEEIEGVVEEAEGTSQVDPDFDDDIPF